MLSDLSDWVIDVIDKLSYVGVALLVALENLFPPIPSEVVLPFAGVVVRREGASLPGMVLAATVGSLVGGLVLYGLAAAVGPERLHGFVLRYGRWFRVTSADVARAERWFDRRAVVAVLVGRCVPLIRSLVSIPAGFRRMPLGRFVAYTALGSLAWNTGLIGAGHVLGEEDRWRKIETVMGYVQYVVVLALVAAVGWFVWTRFVSAEGRRRATAGDIDGDHLPDYPVPAGDRPDT
ncbi:MAG TPA: DedA family protein [Acidimicrobiales bacterium]|nr:DedA family protein [Acidimicrobiales bacterium]